MEVILSKSAQKDLIKVPLHIKEKLFLWIESVSKFGIDKVRHSSGWHDEPLKGNRQGQRSIRLNKAYRAIYILKNYDELEFVEVIEVNKHDY